MDVAVAAAEDVPVVADLGAVVVVLETAGQVAESPAVAGPVVANQAAAEGVAVAHHADVAVANPVAALLKANQ